MKNNDITRDSIEKVGIVKDIKILLVGPAKCGKTSLVQRFVNNTFCDTYIPTGFEKYSKRAKINEYTIDYSIWDTSGSEAYDTVRPLAYQDANIFLLCFNIGDSDSLDSAITKWYPEIRQHCSQTPIILCGCKSDTRINLDKISYSSSLGKTKPVTQEQILDICRQINASMYVETSSLYSNTAVPEAFEFAAKIGLGLINNNNKINSNSNSNNINTNSKTNKKQKNKINNNLNNNNLKNKTNIRNELKGKAKNCCLM